MSIEISEMSLPELKERLDRVWGAQMHFESASFLTEKDYESLDELNAKEELLIARIKELENKNDIIQINRSVPVSV